MEEKKQIKINLKTAIIMICIFFILAVIIRIFIYNKATISQYLDINTINVKTYKNKEYYIIQDDYRGEYDIQYVDYNIYMQYIKTGEEDQRINKIINYQEYVEYCDKCNINQKYKESNQNYIIISSTIGSGLKVRIAGVISEENNTFVYYWKDVGNGGEYALTGFVIFIPTEKACNTDVVLESAYTKKEFNNIKKYDNPLNPIECVDKPVIYLYPNEETKVNVKLLNSENITCSYPKYIDGWNVLANATGELVDIDTKRNLYALYYESKSIVKFDVSAEGFIVKGENVAKFLEEKLAILGLNERESEEFIIYWLPKLEANKYNYIRFATTDEINKNMPLEVNPNPDTIIRVLMTYKGLENPIDVQEQKLITPNRIGFVAVEWGGTEIK